MQNEGMPRRPSVRQQRQSSTQAPAAAHLHQLPARVRRHTACTMEEEVVTPPRQVQAAARLANCNYGQTGKICRQPQPNLRSRPDRGYGIVYM